MRSEDAACLSHLGDCVTTTYMSLQSRGRSVLLISLTKFERADDRPTGQDTTTTSPTPAFWSGIILTATERMCTDHKWCGTGERMWALSLLLCILLFETSATGGRRQDRPYQIQVLVFFPCPSPSGCTAHLLSILLSLQGLLTRNQCVASIPSIALFL